METSHFSGMLLPLYYRGAGASIVVYDKTSPKSFNEAQYWVKVLGALPSTRIVHMLTPRHDFRDTHENLNFTYTH